MTSAASLALRVAAPLTAPHLLLTGPYFAVPRSWTSTLIFMLTLPYTVVVLRMDRKRGLFGARR